MSKMNTLYDDMVKMANNHAGKRVWHNQLFRALTQGYLGLTLKQQACYPRFAF